MAEGGETAMRLYIMLMHSILWVAATVGAFVYTATAATHEFEMTDKLSKRWWMGSLLYLLYALFVCAAVTIFLLLYEGLL